MSGLPAVTVKSPILLPIGNFEMNSLDFLLIAAYMSNPVAVSILECNCSKVFVKILNCNRLFGEADSGWFLNDVLINWYSY
jgi:hypothetical protein